MGDQSGFQETTVFNNYFKKCFGENKAQEQFKLFVVASKKEKRLHVLILRYLIQLSQI